MEQNEMKQNIMSRVRTIHKVRKIVHPFRIKMLILVVGIIFTEMLVSVPNVIKNLLSLARPDDAFGYMAQAFVHTGFAVQLTLVVTLCAALLIVKDFAQSFIRFNKRNFA